MTATDPENELPAVADLDALNVASGEPEAKVVAATSAAGAALMVLTAILGVLQGTAGIMHLPAWVVVLGGALVTALTSGITYAGAYNAPHTPRPDLPASQR